VLKGNRIRMPRRRKLTLQRFRRELQQQLAHFLRWPCNGTFAPLVWNIVGYGDMYHEKPKQPPRDWSGWEPSHGYRPNRTIKLLRIPKRRGAHS
jgi:hypothetical protein